MFFTKFYEIEKNNMKSAKYIQSVIDNLRARYLNVGPGNEWGPRERTRGPKS